jgi:hypothetical protein
MTLVKTHDFKFETLNWEQYTRYAQTIVDLSWFRNWLSHLTGTHTLKLKQDRLEALRIELTGCKYIGNKR